MTPKQLSNELRNDSGNFIEERRGVIVLSLTAIGCMGLIALYQSGILRRLPDPALVVFAKEDPYDGGCLIKTAPAVSAR